MVLRINPYTTVHGAARGARCMVRVLCIQSRMHHTNSPRFFAMNRILGTDRIEILDLARAGATPEAIAFGYPYHVRVIAQLVQRQRMPGAKGHKIGAELAQRIRDRFAAGDSISGMAVEYGVHRNTISRVVNAHHWKA